MAGTGRAEGSMVEFLGDYNKRVDRWTAAVWAERSRPDQPQDAVGAKADLLGLLYQVPQGATPLVPRLAEDLRLWQEATTTIGTPGAADSDRPESAPLATVATATAIRSLHRINRARLWSMGLAGFVVVLAVLWSVSVSIDNGSAAAGTALLLLTVFAVLTQGSVIAFGRRRGLVLTALVGAVALVAPGVVGIWVAANRAVVAWSFVLASGAGVLVVAAGLWLIAAPVDTEPVGRLRLLQRLADELWPVSPPRQERDHAAADAPSDSEDARTLARLIDQLDEEVADGERRHRRASRTWQATHVLLASLAAVTAGAAGVVTSQTQPDPRLGAVTILAASAAALSGLLAALNPGKRQEDNRLTALGAQALRREIRVLREHDIRHDPVVRKRVRDALEDLTVRFETILGRPAEPSYWRRNHPEPLTATSG